MTFAGERDGEGETREHDAAATSAPGDESPETVEARGEQPADPPVPHRTCRSRIGHRTCSPRGG